jgi:hypothetical protein
MRDPNRIDSVLHAIRNVWEEHPDFRLGQLIVNAVQPSEPNAAVFGVEDSQLIKKLEKLRQRLVGSAAHTTDPSCSIETLNEITGPDFRLAGFDGWTLTVHAAFTSYPDAWYAKIEFEGVSFLDCPTDFSHATFRAATDDERNAVSKKAPIEADDRVIAISAETMAGMGAKTFFIVCQALSVTRKTA